jgi:hypothetical protein
MKLKQAILTVMGRDELKRAVDDLDMGDVDRRSIDDMRRRLSRARLATPELLLQYLYEEEVKDICALVGVAVKGRRGALIEALLETEASAALAASTRRNSKEEKIEKPTHFRAEPAVKEVITHWMRPEEVKVSEPPTEKSVVIQQHDPVSFEITRTELVWPGKYDRMGFLVEPPSVSLPFQVIEVIQEGRTSREELKHTMLPLFGEMHKNQNGNGWRNKLIWGDNLLVEASLLKEFSGKIDLIYIDPPFATGSDFSFTARIGEADFEIEKEQSAIEQRLTVIHGDAGLIHI